MFDFSSLDPGILATIAITVAAVKISDFLKEWGSKRMNGERRAHDIEDTLILHNLEKKADETNAILRRIEIALARQGRNGNLGE